MIRRYHLQATLLAAIVLAIPYGSVADEAVKPDYIIGSLTGTWEQSEVLDRKLGFGNRETEIRKQGGVNTPTRIEITIDKTLGDTVGKDELPSYRAYVARDEHELIATGRIKIRFAADDEQSSETMITNRRGTTYVWYTVVNFGMLPARVSLIPGAEKSLDMLTLDFDPIRDFSPDERRSRSVALYQRAKK